ncbi:2,3-diphosphoglycerate-dependent phosphoglycerate mutase [Rhodovibrionaceae bacterium A322]
MPQLVLLRHGQSVWNKENRFTGWKDVDLSEQGVSEAKAAGKLIAEHDLKPDLCFTSYLTRAIKTLHLAQENMDRLWAPVEKSWRLNERHYGDLQGLNKAETAAKVGEEQVKIWRRSYDTPPPAIALDDERHPRHEERYRELTAEQLPATESLKLTVERVLPYWDEAIAPALKSGKRVLIAAHGNSLRGLVKFLDKVSDEDILSVEIATGRPLFYQLDDDLKPVDRYYLDERPVA